MIIQGPDCITLEALEPIVEHQVAKSRQTAEMQFLTSFLVAERDVTWRYSQVGTFPTSSH